MFETSKISDFENLKYSIQLYFGLDVADIFIIKL